MKKIYLKLCRFFFFLVLISLFIVVIACEKFKTSDLGPGISIYKTNGDYFDLVSIGLKGEEVYCHACFACCFGDSACKLIATDDDTIYVFRQRLIDGFILDTEADERYDVFLSLSFKDYLNLEQKYDLLTLPEDTIVKYLFDRDPYTEFYRNKTEVKRFFYSDSLEINEIIKNNEIAKYFEKIK